MRIVLHLKSCGGDGDGTTSRARPLNSCLAWELSKASGWLRLWETTWWVFGLIQQDSSDEIYHACFDFQRSVPEIAAVISPSFSFLFFESQRFFLMFLRLWARRNGTLQISRLQGNWVKCCQSSTGLREPRWHWEMWKKQTAAPPRVSSQIRHKNLRWWSS